MRQLWYVFIILANALLIAGCGGGSGEDRGTIINEELGSIQSAIGAKGANWTAAENPISSLPVDQRDLLNGAIFETTPGTPRVAMRNAIQSTQLPSSIDWRNHNGNDWTTSIKDQGRCGSCVAFATIGVVESMFKITNNIPSYDIDLSECELYSCGGRDCNTNRGWYLSAAASRLKSPGVVDEPCLTYSLTCSSHPYCTLDKTCSDKCTDWQSRLTAIDSWAWVPADQTSIKNYLVQGPVLAAINVYNDFYFYKSGIYEYVYGSKRGGHAVSIVGYNDAGGYWIVRNSWGARWGENGYVNIKYGEIGIEDNVLALQMSASAGGVVASVDQTSVTLSGGLSQVELTCSTNGIVSIVEGRCDDSGSWENISSSNTIICSYTMSGSYTPGCRINGNIVDDVDTPITVSQAGQTAACGNGIVESGETCDDGNIANGDGCSSTCSFETWAKIFGGSSYDQARDVQQTTDGGYIIAGSTSSYGNVQGDMWIVKIQQNGELEWDVSYGGSETELAASVKQTADSGYIVAGYTTSLGAGDAQGWILKLDSSGNKIWDFEIGGSSSDKLWAVIQNADGDYIAVGETVVSSGTDSSFNVWAVKFDNNGNIIWQKTFGGSADAGAYAVQQTQDSGYIISGYTDNFLSALILKVDSNGNELWQRSFDITVGDMDSALDVIQVSDGGYAIACSRSVIKVDSNGNQLWEQPTGAISLVETAGGQLAIVGRRNNDIIMLKLDSNGNQLSEQTHGGSGDEYPEAIIQTDDGGFVIAGYTSLLGTVNTDMLIIKLDPNGQCVNCF